MDSTRLRKWITWSVAGVLLVSLIYWFVTRDRIPSEIRIATGRENGEYHSFATLLGGVIESRNKHVSVEVVETEGSLDNVERLMVERDVELAILQGGSTNLLGFGETDTPVIIAPLFPEVVHVVVRNGRGISNLSDLAGRRIVIGSTNSGMRVSAESLMEHYGLAGRFDEAQSNYFDALPGDDTIDAAVITSGVRNDALKKILKTGDYSLLPVTDASAMEVLDIYLKEFKIPKGLYREQPPVPAAAVQTIATTAFLVARGDLDDLLVEEILASIYEEGLRQQVSTLGSRVDAREWLDLPMHPVARRYFDPQDEIGHMAAVMESLAATKELLFALAAGIYLLWERWRRLKEKEEQAELQVQKDRLDDLLMRTVEIEMRQIGATDENVLRQMLDDVTRIKLQALEELSHEGLRGNRSFLIFLTQCSNLINKIQAKITTSQSVRSRQVYLTAIGLAAGAAMCLWPGKNRDPGGPDDGSSR